MFIDIAYGLFNMMCQIISIIRIDSLSILSNPQISQMSAVTGRASHEHFYIVIYWMFLNAGSIVTLSP